MCCCSQGWHPFLDRAHGRQGREDRRARGARYKFLGKCDFLSFLWSLYLRMLLQGQLIFFYAIKIIIKKTDWADNEAGRRGARRRVRPTSNEVGARWHVIHMTSNIVLGYSAVHYDKLCI